MSSESDLASLIAAIYEAGMDFSLWPYALGRIAAAFDAPSAQWTRPGQTPFDWLAFSSAIDPEYEKKYIRGKQNIFSRKRPSFRERV